MEAEAVEATRPKLATAARPLTFGLIREALGGADVEEVMEARTLRIDWMRLSSLEALDAVSGIRTLYAQHNCLPSLGASLLPLSELRVLVVSDNAIRTLSGALSGLRSLSTLDAARNAVAELDPRADLPRSLRHLVLVGNPWCVAEPRYKSALLAALPDLESLDGFHVRTGEEVLQSAATGEETARVLSETSRASAERLAAAAAASGSGGMGGAEGKDAEEEDDDDDGGAAASAGGRADEAEAYFARLRSREGAGASTEAMSEFQDLDRTGARQELARLREARAGRLRAEVDAARRQATAGASTGPGSAAERSEASAADAAGSFEARIAVAKERSRARMAEAQEAHRARMAALLAETDAAP